jgi:hypothetical protein
MIRRTDPRTGKPYPTSRCPKCHTTIPGRITGGREPTCPECPSKVRGDPESQKARFAPGRKGAGVPSLSTTVPETEDEE